RRSQDRARIGHYALVRAIRNRAVTLLAAVVLAAGCGGSSSGTRHTLEVIGAETRDARTARLSVVLPGSPSRTAVPLVYDFDLAAAKVRLHPIRTSEGLFQGVQINRRVYMKGWPFGSASRW